MALCNRIFLGLCGALRLARLIIKGCHYDLDLKLQVLQGFRELGGKGNLREVAQQAFDFLLVRQ